MSPVGSTPMRSRHPLFEIPAYPPNTSELGCQLRSGASTLTPGVANSRSYQARGPIGGRARGIPQPGFFDAGGFSSPDGDGPAGGSAVDVPSGC